MDFFSPFGFLQLCAELPARLVSHVGGLAGLCGGIWGDSAIQAGAFLSCCLPVVSQQSSESSSLSLLWKGVGKDADQVGDDIF